MNKEDIKNAIIASRFALHGSLTFSNDGFAKVKIVWDKKGVYNINLLREKRTIICGTLDMCIKNIDKEIF